MTNKKLLTIVLAVSIVFLTAYYLFQGKNSDLVSYGYGFKNEKYLSRTKGEVQDFGLLDHRGVFHSLYRESSAKAIVIISQGNDCPIIQKYSLLINDLKNKYGSKNVVFLMLNSARNDTREAIIAEAKKYNFELPILMDPSQLVAESLGITRTSEAVVVTPENWKIVYRGAISDRMDYGVDKQTARNNYVEDVLDAIVDGREIAMKKPSPAKGCLISFVNPKSISYEKVIAPIIVSKCLSCHSEAGGYLPVLDSYDKVKNWVAMSKETILTERMPPWSADPLYGTYKNDLSLTPEEKRAFVKWIDSGAERDGTTDPLAFTKSDLEIRKEKFSKKKPIYTLKYTEKDIPPSGLIEYRYVQLGQEAPRDMWITGLQTLSTNPRLLHHETLMITSKPLVHYEKLIEKYADIDEESRKKNVDGDVTMYVLGTINKYERYFSPENYLRFQAWGGGHLQPTSMEEQGIMIFIPKGSYMILESHYMGTGKKEEETSTFEFYGYDKKPKNLRQIRSIYTTNYNFEIPPMVKDHVIVTPEWTPEQDIHVREFNGHLHMRGVSVKIEITPPGGETRTLASIPNYNQGWGVGTYMELKEPIAIKAGTKFKTTCHYDNSPNNPFNPDPNKKIHFGQRVDRSEMCIMHVRYTNDSEIK